MGYVFLALGAIVVILLLIAVIRALLIKAPAPAPCETELTTEECVICAEKLSAMIQIPTVSKGEDEDLSDFYKFHAELERLFPLLHRHLEKTVLNGTLLYLWKGKGRSKKQSNRSTS